MSSFFLPAKGSKKDRKRKRAPVDRKKTKPGDKRRRGKKSPGLDEEIPSDSDDERAVSAVSEGARRAGKEEGGSGGEEWEESAQEKRLRLAKEYLVQLEEEEKHLSELTEVDRDAISHRLRQDVLEQSGRLQRKVADQCAAPGEGSVRLLRGHQLPVTCLAVSHDDKHLYSGSKDCCIIKWDIETGAKRVILVGKRGGLKEGIGHSGQVLALAVSSDGKYLVSGGQDRVIHVWDAVTVIHVHTFTGHRDTVSGLAFQNGTHELFSCSFDRTVKIWNLDEMAFVETLFGHQDCVSAIDCLSRERPITAGSNDRTVRLWKVVEESQLVFHGHRASIDSVAMINTEHFFSGSQDGSVALWSVAKKKPLVSRAHAVGEEGLTGEKWVSAVAAFPNSDLVASGSCDGFVRLWKCGEGFRSLVPLFSVAVAGFINALSFSCAGNVLVAAVGQEHRLGRWWRHKHIRNTVAIIPLPRTTT